MTGDMGEKQNVVFVGVTGHRFLADTDRIKAGVEEALDRIEKKFPGRTLAIVSALAEGADRLVTHRVLARMDSRLVVPLPLPPPDYMTDFESAESKEEFLSLSERASEVVELPPAPTREEAYEAAGIYVLARCDVLIAVWDGRGAQGRGGTGQIVRRACEKKMPLAWVRAGNRRPGTREPTSLGDEQGRVTFENF